MPRRCMTNTLPIDDGLGDPLFLDAQHLRGGLQGLFAEEQAEEGGVAVVEEDEEEERRPSVTGGAALV